MTMHSDACSQATGSRRIGRWQKPSACARPWERRGWVWKRPRARKRFTPSVSPSVGKTYCIAVRRGNTFPSVVRVEGRTLFLHTRVFIDNVFVDNAPGNILGGYAVFAALYLETQRFDTGIAGSESNRKAGDRGSVGIGVERCRCIVFCSVRPSAVG